MSKVFKSLLYAGLEKEQFEELLPEARDENARFVRIYSGISVLIFGVCLLISFLSSEHLGINRPVYLMVMLICGGLYLGTKLVLPRHKAFTVLFCSLYICTLYGYSFAVSLLHPGNPGVAGVAILLVMPSLFNYRPINMILATILAQVVFCLLSVNLKAPGIATMDIWNCVFFGTIAILLSVYQMRVKFRLLHEKHENRYMSETDLMTGTKNRNCFEKNKQKYESSFREKIFCLYADANGLHELNNLHGHDAGDLMLQTVAAALIRKYGQNNTYRVGGDEFIVFCTDLSDESVQEDIAGIIKAVADAGYSVSIGFSSQDRAGYDIRALVHDAEQAMYRAKDRYYEENGLVHR